MATEKKIIVTAYADGTSNIEGQGFPDGTCLKETEPLEKALGGNVVNRSLKPEAARAVAAGKATMKVGG